MSPEWKIEIRQARTWLTSVRRKKNNLNGGGMPTAYTRRSPPVLTSSSNVNLSGNGSNETATRRIWRGIFLSLFPFLLIARAAPRSIRIPSIPNSKALRTQLIKPPSKITLRIKRKLILLPLDVKETINTIYTSGYSYTSKKQNFETWNCILPSAEEMKYKLEIQIRNTKSIKFDP